MQQPLRLGSDETSERKDGKNTIPCGIEWEVGALVENISGLIRKTITSALCFPGAHSSDAIRPHISRILETPRPPIGRIGRNITPCGAGLEAEGWKLWRWLRKQFMYQQFPRATCFFHIIERLKLRLSITLSHSLRTLSLHSPSQLPLPTFVIKTRITLTILAQSALTFLALRECRNV